jgi:hypothetical protein
LAPDDVELLAVRADQPAVDQVVEPDGDAVRAQRRPLLGRLLQHREGGEDLAVGLEGRPQGVHAGRLEPLGRPVGQVPAAGPLERAEQVAEHGVAVLVLGEVGLQRGQEGVLADPGHQLLEHRRALGVGDPVEVDGHRLDVGDVGAIGCVVDSWSCR